MNTAELTINTIRTLSMDAVQKANSGHPGAPMGLAASAYVIWHNHLNHNPANHHWWNRDRFVLSNGHASMLMYSLLHLSGYEQMTMDQIKSFRQWGSITPGHPEVHVTDGVETTTGPLGQGLATAVGMAMAEAQLNAKYDGLIDHYTFGICSDGDLMEGITAEACSIAGHLGLGKLIFLFDDNDITIDGRTDITFTEDVLKRFQAYGWHVDRVDDGNDVAGIDAAINNAKKVTDKPSLISVKTTIGFGSPSKADKSSSHGSPLGDEEILATKAQLGWEHTEPFFVPDAVREHFSARARGAEKEATWQQKFDSYASTEPLKAAELKRRMTAEFPIDWEASLPTFDADTKGLATRASGGKIIASLYAAFPELTGGSADLAGSTKTLHLDFGLLERGNFDGQNVHFGVREHGMAAIANGMCLHGGVRGFGATFLVFSDYMKPALRVAALSNVPSLMVFTHDSVGLGEDGPTHQPVEHLASLRSIPNYFVFRPADANETTVCWAEAMKRKDGPSCLVLTRQNVPTLDTNVLTQVGDAHHGGYVVSDCDGTPAVILIATGSEVSPSIAAQAVLKAEGVSARVVSLPCWSLFGLQSKSYRDSILPPSITARVGIEAASSFGWERFIGFDGKMISIDTFGHSAPAEVVFEKLGFTATNIASVAKSLL